MPPFSVSHKIEIRRFGRVRGGLQRSFTRRRNRSRRQAANHVGIIRRWRLQIFSGNPAVVVFAHAVDDGRIGLQTHADAQTVNKHRGNLVTFGSHGRLFLDDRGHRHELVLIFIRQALCSPFPGSVYRRDHFVVRALQNGHIGSACRIHPRIGPEPAFHPLGMFEF
ncbi:Uncharacterised protein [Enterobacter cloacae]|nr:Uncharacterised protein [Enterobacter cloacae]